MHELSITRNILEIVNDKTVTAGRNPPKVKNILVLVGELSGVEPDSVSFYFDLMKKDYNLDEASITFSHVPASMKCGKCGLEFKYDQLSWNCPGCGDPGIAISKGTECYVESIEVAE